MSSVSKKTVVQDMIEMLAKGDSANVDRYFATNWVNHDPSLPPLKGLDGARELIGMWKAAFSDMKVSVEDSVTEGDRVAVRFVVSGRHSGPFMGIAPTGKQIKVSGTGIFRVVDGKSTDNWVNFDALGLLQQLGATSIPQR
jgi:predicted ester cyclase